MTIEVATVISELDHNLPDHDDFVSEGDDHFRLFKKVTKDTLHNVTGVVDATHTEINRLVGVTSAVIDTAKLAALPAAIGTTTPVAGTFSNMTVNSLLRAIATGAVGLATDVHAGQFGPTSGLNIAVGNGVVQGRNAGSAATLAIQSLGGVLTLGSTSDVTNALVLQNLRTQVRANNALTLMLQNTLDGAPAIGAAIDVNMGLYSSSGTRRMFLGFSSSIDLYLQNDSTSGAIRARGMSAGAALREMMVLNPGGAVQLSYDDTVRLQTSATGAITTGLHVATQLSNTGAGTNNVDGVWLFGSLSSIIARNATLSLGGDAGFQVGLSNAINLALSGQEIQGRNNGAVAAFFINKAGGSLQIGPDTAGRAYWDATTRIFTMLDGAGLSVSGTVTVTGTGTHNLAGTVNATTTLRRNNIDVVDVQRAVSTATGLTGGGQLNADRTIDYAVQNLSAQGTLIETNDLLLMRDVSAGIHTKVSFGQMKEYRALQRSSNATLTATDYFTTQCWTSSGNGTLTLPTGVEGVAIKFRKVGTGNLTISGSTYKSSNTDTITIRGGEAVAVYLNGVWCLTGDLGNFFSDHEFESGELTVALRGTSAHGLGVVPREHSVVLRCTDAGGDASYTQNQEVDIFSTYHGGQPATTWADDTNIGWSMYIQNPAILSRTVNSATANIVPTKWKIVCRASRYVR